MSGSMGFASGGGAGGLGFASGGSSSQQFSSSSQIQVSGSRVNPNLGGYSRTHAKHAYANLAQTREQVRQVSFVWVAVFGTSDTVAQGAQAVLVLWNFVMYILKVLIYIF